MLGTFQPWVLLFALICLDFALGICKGIFVEGFDSSKVREGLVHKGTYFAAFALVYLLQGIGEYIELPYMMLESMMIFVFVWVTVSEAGSILENITALNPQLSDNSFMRIFAKRDSQDEKKSQDDYILDEDAS